MDEQAYLDELSRKPLLGRLRGYSKLTGPGYLQSAMTLGGGTVASCVLMGSLAGYELLWVQPLAIFLGVCVLAAIAKQTCNSGEKAYTVFWERLHPALAILWGFSALVATVLWHIPQYGLTANGAIVLAEGVGISLDSTPGRTGIGAMVLLSACVIVSLYFRGARGLKLYELAVKALVWAIVLAFGVAAIASGIQWGALFRGFSGIAFFQRVTTSGLPAAYIDPVVGGIAAAVGINMLFLYPYSILKKNWGKKHKELAYFDLASGMALPFLIASGLMIIAVANTIGPDPGAVGKGVRDMREIIPVLDATLGRNLAMVLVGLGMFAVGFSTIITHMLVCGFIGCELFNLKYEGLPRWFFSLLPAVGVVGVMIQFPFYAAVTASLLAAPLMPAAVIGFLLLMNMPSYMGDAMPRGAKRFFWNTVLSASVVVLSAGAYVSLKPKIADLLQRFSAAESIEALPSVHAASGDAPTPYTFSHPAMGTDFEFILYPPSPKWGVEELRHAADEVFRQIDALEARISTWKPASLASKINREAAANPVYVDDDILAMLGTARRIHTETSGAFDLTIGPVVDLWRHYKELGQVPPSGELKHAVDLVGLNGVAVNAEKGTLSFAKEGMRLDFGGIGKGLALDRAAEALRAKGITTALLHGGTSTVLALGAPPGQKGWTVAIRHPYNETGEAVAECILRDVSLSTSGNYDKQFILEGKRYGHIIDPRTGQPILGLLSASAIATTGMESDALSTAFYVMGEDGVRAYCEQHPDVNALLVAEEDGKLRVARINFPSGENPS